MKTSVEKRMESVMNNQVNIRAVVKAFLKKQKISYLGIKLQMANLILLSTI